MQGQVNIQTQQQQQLQQQQLSPLQLQVVRLLEMPVAELEQKVLMELDNNPSLEASPYDADYEDTLPGNDDSTANDDAIDDMARDERERREDALTDALDNFGGDDRMEGTTYSDDYIPGNTAEQRSFEDGNLTSFIDTLNEQMGMEELTDDERQIMEYIIGSLEDDGLLHKDLLTISDELAIYNNMFVTEDEIEAVLLKLQEFDPAGVGARSLQECLLIQVERMKATPMTMLMYRVVNECFDEFTSNHWDRICRTLAITEAQAEELRYEIRHRLNPKPGAAFGEAQGRSLSQITPDIILNIDFDNNISFELNHGRVPQLHIVKEDEDMLRQASALRGKTGGDAAISFLRHNIDKANIFIEAMRQRQETIVKTMKAIVRKQRKYILSGDESDLQPMVLKDVAEATGLDLSTISRVSRAKYVQTPWGTFPLRHFFSEAYVTKDGDTMSTKAIKLALQDAISAEDTRHPLSDDKLVKVMTERGYPIARRTIAKYREQLGIPVARLRKKL